MRRLWIRLVLDPLKVLSWAPSWALFEVSFGFLVHSERAGGCSRARLCLFFLSLGM